VSLEPESIKPGGAARGIFVTTRWSVVLDAARDSTAGPAALETLCRTYWFPVYALVRRRGLDSATACDFTQEFFARLLAKDGLSKVRRERGRFRSFLAQSVRNFLADEWDKRAAQKRGGPVAPISIEAEAAEGRYLEGADHGSPDVLFDRAWVEQLLAESHARLAREFAAAGRGEILAVLDQLGDPDAPSLAESAAQLQVPVNTLKSHLHRARQRQAAILRELIAETVASPVEVEAELRQLLEVWAR
jgi:DNA-directed RNA polymerase specialized sigma24 family protein